MGELRDALHPKKAAVISIIAPKEAWRRRHFANKGGMIPEQAWDRAEATPARFVFGEGTGSATPLAWSMAQFIRLVVCAEEKRIVEQPDVVAAHFLKGKH